MKYYLEDNEWLYRVNNEAKEIHFIKILSHDNWDLYLGEDEWDEMSHNFFFDPMDSISVKQVSLLLI
jgi:hypothetical protein